MNEIILVSIIMNCYNGGKYLIEAIDSVIGQTYKNWELIFWDNASSDISPDIVKSFPDVRIKYYRSETKTNLGRARNLAIDKAEGELIAFLDVDDIWSPSKLEKQVDIYLKNPKIGLIYTKYTTQYENGVRVNENRSFNTPQRGFVFEKLLLNHFIAFSSVVIPKHVIFEFKGFQDFHIVEERDLFLKISFKYSFDYIDEHLVIIRLHDSNESKKIDLWISEEQVLWKFWNDKLTSKNKKTLKEAKSNFYFLIGRKYIFSKTSKKKGRHYSIKSLNSSIQFKCLVMLLLSFFPLRFISSIRNAYIKNNQ